MKNKHKNMLKSAIDRSINHNPNIRESVVSILTSKNKKKYIGKNQRKSHPLQKKFGSNKKAIYLHAEIDAIRKAYRVEGEIVGSTLYVARTKADGEIAMSAPCEACEEAINYFGVGKVFFTTKNGTGEMYG